MKAYAVIIMCNLILERFEANNGIFDSNNNDESGTMSDMLNLHNAYRNAEKGEFNDALRSIGSNYDAIIIKKLNDSFIVFEQKASKNKEKYMAKGNNESFTENLK